MTKHRLFFFQVYKCKRSFQRHINVVHLGMDYQFKCFYCQHQFLTSNQLREHVAWQHFGEKPHHCRYCDKTFVCRPTMIRHERNEHTGSKPYKCRFCPEAFVEKVRNNRFAAKTVSLSKIHFLFYSGLTIFCGSAETYCLEKNGKSTDGRKKFFYGQ